ncbi:MAG: YdcF family protein [Patescibacteria group bacterium]
MERNRAVIICLSGGLEVQDKIPLRVKARLDTAYDLYMNGDFVAVITTSKGTYRDPIPHSTTEAEAGKMYLLGRGLTENQLFVEENSMDTVGNAFFLRVALLDRKGWTEPTIVTNEFHMLKARYIFDSVLDGMYQISYIEAPNSGITEQELDKWRRHEEEILKFYQRLFVGVRKGDLAFFERYIYDRNPAYNGGIMDEEHQELSESIRAIWVNTP